MRGMTWHSLQGRRPPSAPPRRAVARRGRCGARWPPQKARRAASRSATGRPSPRRTPTDPSMAPPSAARVAWDVEQLGPSQRSWAATRSKAPGSSSSRPAPDLVINEDVRFESAWTRQPRRRRPPLDEHVKAVDGADAAGSVNLPILDPRASRTAGAGATRYVVFTRCGYVSEGGRTGRRRRTPRSSEPWPAGPP